MRPKLNPFEPFSAARTLKTGQAIGGIPFTRGPLAYLLRNRFYIGEVVFKGETLPGEQPAIRRTAPTASLALA